MRRWGMVFSRSRSELKRSAFCASIMHLGVFVMRVMQFPPRSRLLMIFLVQVQMNENEFIIISLQFFVLQYGESAVD